MFINTFLIEYAISYFDLVFMYALSFGTFAFGLIGCLHGRRNLLMLLICIELMLIGIGLHFIFTTLLISKVSQVYALFIITVAATESSIGLSLLIIFYRSTKNIAFVVASNLRF